MAHEFESQRVLAERAQRRRRTRASSPVALVVLILVVGLFVFSALAGSRGGMSGGGCLPATAAERNRLRDEWFSSEEPKPDQLHSSCPLAGGLLRVRGVCTIQVDSLGPEPTSFWERIRAAFREGPRALRVQARSSAVVLRFLDRQKDARAVEATLKKSDSTSLTVSRHGADVSILCAECELRLGRQPP